MDRLRLVISVAADRDLDAIYDYTATHWGVAQASRYVGSFDAAFVGLLDRPEMGRPVSSSSGHWRLRHESHFIYYRILPGTLRIVRVLHRRMDAPRHLP